MTQAVPADSVVPDPNPPESFLGIAFRRTRYLIATLFSAWLFCTLGSRVAAPPADWGSFSLLAWPSSTLLLATCTIAGLLLLASAVSSLLAYHDTPHMGLCCALMGIAALSIRGGTTSMLIRHAQLADDYKHVSQLLAIECVQWAIIFLVAEVVARGLHDKFFANTRWLTRTGVDLAASLPRDVGARASMGIAISIAKSIGTLGLPRAVATPLAFIANMLLASLFLACFVQSPAKGQVLFGCFAAFFLSTHLVYYAFPRVPAVALFLAVPITGAAGYYFSANHLPKFPGYAGLYFGNVLPIDYICAGIPGAIFGFYLAFHWDLHSRAAESA